MSIHSRRASISILWILISTLGLLIYLNYDWNKRVQEYEQEFYEYKIKTKEWKHQNRRMASPYLLWQIKYMAGPAKNAFTQEEKQCLRDHTACTKEMRMELCERLKAFPNINDCKTIEYIRQEFIALNQHMDYQSPPTKPHFNSYLQTHRNWIAVGVCIIFIPPIILLILRKS